MENNIMSAVSTIEYVMPKYPTNKGNKGTLTARLYRKHAICPYDTPFFLRSDNNGYHIYIGPDDIIPPTIAKSHAFHPLLPMCLVINFGVI